MTDTYEFIDDQIFVRKGRYSYNLFPSFGREVETDRLPALDDQYFLRYSFDFDCAEPTDWYFIIREGEENIDDYKSGVRRKIRKGLKTFDIHPVSHEELKRSGYPVYQVCMDRFGEKPVSRETYLRQMNYEEELGLPIEYFAVFYEGALIGYSKNFCDYRNRYVFYETLNIDREYYKMYVIHALLNVMNTHYTNERGFRYVSDGSKTLLHPSNIDGFLTSEMNFRHAYCHLHVEYHPRVEWLVRMLYPLRQPINRIPLRQAGAVKALLEQERIARQVRRHRHAIARQPEASFR